MKNDIEILPITAMGSEGEGIARRADGYALFVRGAVTGDTAKILVVKENKSYGYGKLLEIVEPSPHRVEPGCGVFNKCGGCTMLAADYPFQLEMKRKKVEDALERIGLIKGVRVEGCLCGEKHTHYRNKAQYPVCERDGKLETGFYAPNSHRVVPWENCILQNPKITQIVNFAKKTADELKIKAYNEETKKGCLRHIYVRCGEAEAMVVLVAAQNDKRFNVLAEKIKEEFPFVVGVVLNHNPKSTNLILGERDTILWGRNYIFDKIGAVSYKINYRSFYQVNPYTTKILYDKAKELCDLKGDETVFDLYCGVGTIGLYFADKAKKIIGVEEVGAAVDDARENAAANGISNALFYCGKAEKICPEIIASGERADVVVLDPPRKGCDEALIKAVAGMRPERVVYVSCNPATLARDAKTFAQWGYNIKTAVAVDQFPGTAHVESVALMVKT